MREQAAKDERFAAMGRLAAAVAHEIRNPLASLSGCLQLLTEDSQNRPARLALQEANRLNRLVDDFLHATSLPGLHREELDIAALAQEVVESVQLDPRINGRIQIKLSTRPVHARLDGDRLKQVLWNLLLNAAQAMPGGGDAEVRVGSQENGVQIQVLDSGKGVPEGDLERIFDPFYTTRAGGSGIGLAVVEQIVRVHGGTVKALPRNPQGTCISLWLPLEPQGVVNGH
jgi:signal transduction histidine kinase